MALGLFRRFNRLSVSDTLSVDVVAVMALGVPRLTKEPVGVRIGVGVAPSGVLLPGVFLSGDGV